MKQMKAIVCGAAASLILMMALLACTSQEIGETLVPETTVEQVVAPVEQPVTVPFTLTLGSDETKVTIEGPEKKYKIQEGDKLSISGVGRTITGTLTYNKNKNKPGKGPGQNNNNKFAFDGELTYYASEGDLFETNAQMEAVLFNDNNPLDFDYGKAVATDLKTAVEQFSRFTANFHANDETTMLVQSSAFLEVEITLYGNSGLTSVPVAVSDASGKLNAKGEVTLKGEKKPGKHETKVSFVAAVPGGIEPANPVVRICGRDIPFTGKELVASNSYKIKRDVYPAAGDPYYSDGIWGTEGHANGAKPVGIIVYVNKGNASAHPSKYQGKELKDSGNHIAKFAEDITGKDKIALVMALHNAAENVSWSSSKKSALDGKGITKLIEAMEDFDGAGHTRTLCGLKDSYPAAKAASEYAPEGTSGWFLPSAGQWVAAVYDLGQSDDAYTWINDNNQLLEKCVINNVLRVKETNNPSEYILNIFNEYMKKYEGTAFDGDCSYWTSSELKKDNKYDKAIRVNFSKSDVNGHNTCFKVGDKDKPSKDKLHVRPFLIF